LLDKLVSKLIKIAVNEAQRRVRSSGIGGNSNSIEQRRRDSRSIETHVFSVA